MVESKKRGTVQQVHCTVRETDQALDQGQRIFQETTTEPLKNSTSDRYFLVQRSLKQTACNPVLIKAGQAVVTGKVVVTGKKQNTDQSIDNETNLVVIELTDEGEVCWYKKYIIGLS